MRTTKELLTIIEENLHHLDGMGLCWLVVRLDVWCDINYEEKRFLLDFISENRPTRWTSWHLFFYPDSVFHWTPGEIKPRRKWLNKHIKRL